MRNDKNKYEKSHSKKVKDTSRQNEVLDTSGGEMPDPPKMPSKTKFHTGSGNGRSAPAKKK